MASNIGDKFNKLKQNIVGTKTSSIDTKLDSTIKDITVYRSKSGSNGYIELVKNIISKQGLNQISNNNGLFSTEQSSPSSFGQGRRIMRYKIYESIVGNISYCKRALDVLTGNILSPDDITKMSLEIKSKTYLEDEVRDKSRVNKVKNVINRMKIDDNLNNIVRNTLLYGDYFCEIADAKTALTSKSMLSENDFFSGILNNEKNSRELVYSHNNIQVTMNYSSFNEATKEENKKDNDDEKQEKINLNNLNLVFHEPSRVVKLQSELFPLCFGYLIFPKYNFMNFQGNPQEQAVNDICMNILQNLQKNIPQAGELHDDDELKHIISSMIKESGGSQVMNIRYVPPNKMTHFMVPSQKFYPYGESIFDVCQFDAKVLTSLTTALAIQRLANSTEKRKIGVEIDLPKDAAKQVQQLKEEFRKRKISLDNMGTIDTIPCLDLNTKIRLLDGFSMPLNEIINQFEKSKELWVYSYNSNTGKLIPNKIKNAKVTGKNVNVVKVTLDNGEIVKCTPEHRWLMRDGSYKEAKDLLENDSLMPFYKRSRYTNSKLYSYEEIYHPGNLETSAKWELTHRAVSEYLGIVNEKNNVCHHIDKNVRNNNPNNLQGLTNTEHMTIHSSDCIEAKNYEPIKIIEECPYCGIKYSTTYFPRYKTCGNPECIKKSKRKAGLNSWDQKKHQEKYKKVEYNCDWCGKTIIISKSFLDRKKFHKQYILCDNVLCKNQAVQYLEFNKKSYDLEYIQCEVCGKFCIYNERKFKQRVCSSICSQTLLSRRRWKYNRVVGKCDWCGKEFECPNGKINKNVKFQSCYDKHCIQMIRELNRSFSLNNKKEFNDIFYLHCNYCGKSFVYCECSNFKDRRKAKSNGYCGISCSHKSYKQLNIDSKNHKVVSVEYCNEKIDVGDIELENHHNFALDSGVIIHNSMISTFENIYVPQKDGKPYMDIESFDAGNVDTARKTEELEYLRSSIVAALGVPNAFLNLEEELCLFSGTYIPMLDGGSLTLDKIIEEYQNGNYDMWTYSYDHETGRIVPGKIVWANYTRLQTQLVRVHLDNGEYVDCTPDHPFMLRDGSYKEAQYLQENESLMPYIEQDIVLNHKVASVEWLEGKYDTGDITIEGFHNFAVEAGVMVHNSNKSVLSEENILFARTIISHQKYLKPQINDLIEKILLLNNPEEALLINESVDISFPSPRSLQYERESRYLGEIVTLIENLERIGVPKEYTKKKYLPQFDWNDVENWEANENIDKNIGSDEEGEEEEGMGGF